MVFSGISHAIPRIVSLVILICIIIIVYYLFVNIDRLKPLQ